MSFPGKCVELAHIGLQQTAYVFMYLLCVYVCAHIRAVYM